MSYNDTLDPTLLEDENDVKEPVDHDLPVPEEGAEGDAVSVPLDPDEVPEPLDDDEEDLSDDETD